MKINKIALLATLMFAASGTSVILAADDNQQLAEVVTPGAETAGFFSNYSWMQLSILAIVLVVLLLICAMWWSKRRGNKKA